MKNMLSLIGAFIIFGCSDSNSKLETEIISLKKENLNLKDSLAKINNQELLYLKMIVNPQITNHNSENKINGHFVFYKKLKPYRVYWIDTRGQKHIISDSLTDPEFEFIYNPKDSKLDSIDVFAEFNTHGKQYKFFAKTHFISN